MNSKLLIQKPNNSINVSVLNSPLKISGSIFIGLATITAIWGFSAPIPVKVSGLGVLMPVDAWFTYKSPSVGNVLLPFIYNEKNSKVEYAVPLWTSRA